MRIFKKPNAPLSPEEIVRWLRELRAHSHVPSSGFTVTAVFRAKLGAEDLYYFAGVNIENPFHRLSTHGEEGCIAALATALRKRAEVVEGWVMGAPARLNPGDSDFLANNKVSCCGKCRQQIAGFADSSVMIHSVSLNGEFQDTTVGDFLPNAFTFRQFAPELLKNESSSASDYSPTAYDVEQRLVRIRTSLSRSDIISWLQQLESIDFASKTSQAVIIKLANDAYVAGVKVEEAAFVSIDPVQSAVAIAQAEFGNQKIVEAWSFSKGRDEAKFRETQFTPLTLAGMQILSQFTSHNNIPIHLINAKGEQFDMTLNDASVATPLPSP